MKIEKNKIIFITAIGLVVLFIVGYAFMLTDDGDGTDSELKQPEVPELKEEQKEYGSKLEAVDDVREEREIQRSERLRWRAPGFHRDLRFHARRGRRTADRR